MIGFVFVIFFALSFPSEGKIILPPEGDTFIVAPGTNVKIAWTFDNVIGTLGARQWLTETGDVLALIILDGDVEIKNIGKQLGVNVTKNGTLILKNVDRQHNGKYTFQISLAGNVKKSSDVTVFVAVNSSLIINCTSPLTLIISDNATSTLTVNKNDDVRCLCKDEAGNPPTDVTWYKNGVQHGVPKINENLLSLNKVDGEESGTYKCEAQSYILKDQKSIKVIVNFAPEAIIISSSPTKAVLGKSVTMTCNARGHPEPSYTIIHNNNITVSTNKTYTIDDVKYSDAGSYRCVAENKLGELSITIKLTIASTDPVQTPTVAVTTENSSTNACTCNKVESGGVVVWHVVLSLLSGIIIGVLLSCIVLTVYIRCRRFKNRKPAQANPQQQTSSKVDSIYQDLDLSKMNQEENYQTLGVVNSGDHGESDYTELNLARDVEDNYQSLQTST